MSDLPPSSHDHLTSTFQSAQDNRPEGVLLDQLLSKDTGTYSPLDSEQHEIRLLSILSAPDDSDSKPIECHLRKARLKDLGEEQKYIALSYTWGNPGERLPITVNGKTTQVTTNLESALRHLKVRFGPWTLFWIDAVCINQEDEQEKSQQVSRMRDVFAKAEVVIMWVGEEDEFTSSLFALFERSADYAHKYRESSHSVEPRHDALLEAIEGTKDEGDDQNYERILLQTAGPADMLEAFLRRRYFTRCWIVQEVVVSRYAELVCGTFSISFDKFIRGCAAITFLGPYKMLRRGAMMEITHLGWWQENWQQKQDHAFMFDLMYLLVNERDKQASDPRDKVFALLGIANQAAGPLIAVDYSKSVEEVYTTVARHLLIARNPWEVLSAAQGQWSKLSMPSWVPDWSQDWHGSGFVDNRLDNTPFRAAGYTEAVLVPCQDQSAICLRGMRIDVVRQSGVVRLCNRPTADGKPFVNEDNLHADIKLLGLNDENHYDITDEEYVDAYLRTITADRSALSSRHKDEFYPVVYPATYAWTQAGRPGSGPPEEVWHEISEDVAPWVEHTDIFITEEGFLGRGPSNTQVLDVVCIFLGGQVPFILHPQEESTYRLIGECYVHGVMDGEVIEGLKETDLEDFIIK